ncbi:hypothetical protein P3S67_007013 [Capsicum chacoense]
MHNCGTSKSKFHPRPKFAKRSKEKDNFTLHGKSYASLFERLRQRGMSTTLLGYTPYRHLRNFDPNVRCAYHSGAQGHNIEDYRDLKIEIKNMIQDGSIMV